MLIKCQSIQQGVHEHLPADSFNTHARSLSWTEMVSRMDDQIAYVKQNKKYHTIR